MSKQWLWTWELSMFDSFMTRTAECDQICQFICFSPIVIKLTIRLNVMHIWFSAVLACILPTYNTFISIAYQRFTLLASPISSAICKFTTAITRAIFTSHMNTMPCVFAFHRTKMDVVIFKLRRVFLEFGLANRTNIRYVMFVSWLRLSNMFTCARAINSLTVFNRAWREFKNFVAHLTDAYNFLVPCFTRTFIAAINRWIRRSGFKFFPTDRANLVYSMLFCFVMALSGAVFARSSYMRIVKLFVANRANIGLHSVSLSLYHMWVSADGVICRRFGYPLADFSIIPQKGT